ncbi:MAG: hypothetical protein AB1714_29045 [Acidobacteriota bacterium]
MDGRSRLLILLALLAATIALAVSSEQPAAAPPSTPRRPSSSRYVWSEPVPVVRGFPDSPPDVATTRPWRRNPFVYADEPEAPVYAPPPPPPPPPEIKPQSRFIGTVQRGEMIAVFSWKNDVFPLRKGEVLDDMYMITSIEPEFVTIEDTRYHNTAILSLGGRT